MEFKDFKRGVKNQMKEMTKGEMFKTNISKSELWETYLESFPEGTNEIFQERREYDCQACKQFIKGCGNAVSIVDSCLISIWDIEIGGHYQVVADALSALVKSQPIRDRFYHFQQEVGIDNNHSLVDGEPITWEHFHYSLPLKFVMPDSGTALSHARSNQQVFKRSLEEISLDAADTVLELIEQGSLYRGDEHKNVVTLFVHHKTQFNSIPEDERDNYCWEVSTVLGGASKIKNTVMGTLLVDISNNVGLDASVRMFESKVAPTNYKRPSAIVTKSMIENAEKFVTALGIGNSLPRRYAVTEDITITNVKFANREAKKAMSVFDEMKESAPVNIKNLDKVDEVDIETFLNDILPKVNNVELMVENKHQDNLMSLIAPINDDSKNIFKWDNNFSWAYKGEVADSLKARVKKAGGNVDGVLRFSIQWNDGDNNQNDFDAHCIEPNGNLIHYPLQKIVQPSSGILDVDIVHPDKKVAVENITWSNINKMQEGEYRFLVHNYNHCGGKTGFSAEIEYGGKIYSYVYDKELRHNEKVIVADIEFSKEKGIKFLHSLPTTTSSKEVWGINTHTFSKVSMIMNSPNHWDGKTTGNKHHFFILEDCLNPDKARGFFNEFLKEDLTEHRKVFEVLGSKMKVERTDNQLSGIGFSSTQRNSVLCKLEGSFSRIIKINF